MTVKYKLEVITTKGVVFLKVETSSKSLLEGILARAPLKWVDLRIHLNDGCNG